MTGQGYRDAIAKLGLTQRAAARFFEVGESTGAKWANEGCPPAVSMMLDLMVVLRISPAWINWVLGREPQKE